MQLVAKSYQNMEIVHEPFQKNGRMYVEVKTSKGTIKQVRWYSQSEYAKMYPEDKKDKTKDPYYKPQKYVLGFDKGYRKSRSIPQFSTRQAGQTSCGRCNRCYR